MSSGKELNIAGNKVINVADPRQPQDAATKGYVDRTVRDVVWEVHNYNALSTGDEYIHVINEKDITMANLAGICKVTTDWKVSAGTHTYSQPDLVHIWLESVCCSNNLWLPTQDLKNKYIAVEYKFRVQVQHWGLRLRYINYKHIEAKFHWEVSNDGAKWRSVTKPADVRCTAKSWNGNTHILNFTNTDYKYSHPFWRIVIDQGIIPPETNNEPWVNLLSMKLYQ